MIKERPINGVEYDKFVDDIECEEGGPPEAPFDPNVTEKTEPENVIPVIVPTIGEDL
jgi:hypothetical protein